MQVDTVCAAETRLRGLIFRKQFDMLEPKDLKPEGFNGRNTENCNTAAEAQQIEILDLTPAARDQAEAVDSKSAFSFNSYWAKTRRSR